MALRIGGTGIAAIRLDAKSIFAAVLFVLGHSKEKSFGWRMRGEKMLTIMVAITIALSLACIVLMKARPADPTQLSQPRPALLTMGVQIVCGNCSGDEWQPVKTYLDVFGNCSQCGGRSYLLASAVAAGGALARAARARDMQIASGLGRVLPFELPGTRSSRSERIAV